MRIGTWIQQRTESNPVMRYEDTAEDIHISLP